MGESRPLRLLIADDHEVVRKGLWASLQIFNGIELVGQAANGEEAVRLCQQTNPDVVLMDLVMPIMDGVEATREILKKCPEVKVISLTSYGETERVQAALEAGAKGYLLKNISLDELVIAIKNIGSGRSVYSPEVTIELLKSNSISVHSSSNLTKRELEILALMVEGMSNPEMSTHLMVSISTVKFHISNILLKLGADNRAEAVAQALKHHLLPSKPGQSARI